ncbi:hypothetical protein OH787_06335 [Streptomyces sp. NBC_01547]
MMKRDGMLARNLVILHEMPDSRTGMGKRRKWNSPRKRAGAHQLTGAFNEELGDRTDEAFTVADPKTIGIDAWMRPAQFNKEPSRTHETSGPELQGARKYEFDEKARIDQS